MARRPGVGRGLDLSPRARILGGWLVALLLVLGIAGAVRLLGESGDASAPGPGPSNVASGSPHPIRFGTTLTAERLVPVEALATTFGPDDTFAYAVPDASPANEVYVEVRRTDGGPAEVVQEAVESQAIPDGPALIGFTVPAANLIDAWGPGAYSMRILLEPEGRAVAEGSFVLVQAGP